MNPTVIHVVCGILHHAWHFIVMVGLNVKQELQLPEIFSEANGSFVPHAHLQLPKSQTDYSDLGQKFF